MSKVKQYPSQEILKQNFIYANGFLIHKNIRVGVKQGSIAGYESKTTGYISIGLNSSKYRAHRLIWIFHHGYSPSDDIDHIDGNKTNNKIENLRVLTRSQNLHNAKAKRGNKGGCTGVNWVASKKYWQATICINYKQQYLGSSNSYLDACALRKSAENKFCPIKNR